MTALDLRDRFDLPEDVAYLNAAYMGPLPKTATAALRAAAERKAQPWRITPADFFDEAETLRGQVARLLGASAEDVALAPSASHGLATAAKILPVARGQEILILADQFPSNVYAWRSLAARRGARLRTLTRRRGASWTEAILNAMSPKTAIVACANTHWIDGGRIDVAAVGQAARSFGAAFVLDLTQSLGAQPFDVAAVDPDFVAVALYKWLLAPYSLAGLYVAPRWKHAEPLEQTWLGRAGSENFARLIDYTDARQAGARAFDAGQRSNFHTLPGAIAALDLILELGPKAIEASCRERTAELAQRLASLRFSAEPEPIRSAHYLSLERDAGLPADFTQALASRNVFVSQRGARVRITPHVYNADADLDRLVEACAAVLR